MAPVAVRDVRWNGVRLNLREVANCKDIIENSPKHIESTAQIVAEYSGGGWLSSNVGVRKPTNFGGGRKSRVSRSWMEAIGGCKSGSLVCDESELS